jgi:hypothetical protein
MRDAFHDIDNRMTAIIPVIRKNGDVFIRKYDKKKHQIDPDKKLDFEKSIGGLKKQMNIFNSFYKEN